MRAASVDIGWAAIRCLRQRFTPPSARSRTFGWLRVQRGLGFGWVSILDPEALKELLGVPGHMVLVAYLCLGYVDDFAVRPELEAAGWESRLPLDEVVCLEHFDGEPFPRN